MSSNDQRQRRLYGLYFGEVTRRDDPEGRARVRFRIPGLIDGESADWAVQIGIPGSGHAQSGGPFHPPPIGANVAIFFEQGDPDSPVYLAGPWGAPDGVSDAPTGYGVEGDDRQKAVTEDPAWLIERDSTGVGVDGYIQKWWVRHKNAGAEIVVRSDDKVHLVRDGATEAVPTGTTGRAAEAAYLSDMFDALAQLGVDLAAAGNIAAVNLAGADLGTALTAVSNKDMKDDATAYLSTKLFTE